MNNMLLADRLMIMLIFVTLYGIYSNNQNYQKSLQTEKQNHKEIMDNQNNLLELTKETTELQKQIIMPKFVPTEYTPLSEIDNFSFSKTEYEFTNHGGMSGVYSLEIKGKNIILRDRKGKECSEIIYKYNLAKDKTASMSFDIKASSKTEMIVSYSIRLNDGNKSTFCYQNDGRGHYKKTICR
ncbi:MAG: hypothetical protein K8R39_09465 [Arcobacteraceae bacterium]|nr:hypothetical protein [Arcobacteraceae bacterium]